MPRWREVPPDTWVAALADPRRRVVIDLAACPSPFRQRRPWDTRLITLREHLLYLVLGDPLRLECDGGSHDLARGTFLCMPPGAPFRVTLADGSGAVFMQRLRLRLDAPRAGWRLAGGPLVVDEAWALEERFAALVREAEESGPHHHLLLGAHAAVLFAEAFRLRDAHAGAGRVLSSAQRLRLRQAVRRGLPRWLTPADLAAEVELSPDYFTRVFRRTFGTAPRPWLVAERLRVAAELLAQDERSIGEVAIAVGYGDRNLFGRQFVRVMGTTPRVWRDGRRA
jgi:AraC-like DNA-binding protein